MPNRGTFQKLQPLALLAHLSSCYDSARLQVFNNSVVWSFYLDRGKIIYASHSVEPFERLERHLHLLIPQTSRFNDEVLTQLRSMFATGAEVSLLSSDYQAVNWLVSQQYLSPEQAALLIEGLAKEVIESFLLVDDGTYELDGKIAELNKFCELELQPLVEYCQKQLQGWRSLGPEIWSPYQRPYFSRQSRLHLPLVAEILQKLRLGATLKGFSFYHLAALTDRSALQIAQSLQPYIISGTVSLHDPSPEFDKLPQVSTSARSPHLIEQIAEPLVNATTSKSATIPDKIPVASTPVITRDRNRKKTPKVANINTIPKQKPRYTSYSPLIFSLGVIVIFAGFLDVFLPYTQSNEISSLKTETKYKECINKAEAFNRNTLFSQAVRGVLNECIIGRAKELAGEGKLAEAISAVKKIPKNSPLYPESQKLVEEWSEI